LTGEPLIDPLVTLPIKGLSVNHSFGVHVCFPYTFVKFLID